MADVVVNAAFWSGKRVLVTGHTGFKGAWLTLWLRALGADVVGLAREVPTEPSLYALARVGEGVEEVRADVRDYDAVRAAVVSHSPDVVMHLAAQPIVRASFADPRGTYETNVMGTVNVLEAVRAAGGVAIVVNVTSDKCYENREWEWGYREDEPMGGHDPYSSSKACSEIVTAAYRRSFEVPVASVRAGNVIGGGDWAADRLVPDLMRSALEGEQLRIRNPNSIRPWQHVLNPLSGYLAVAEAGLTEAFNFGPVEDDAQPVSWIVERVASLWPGGLEWESDPGPHPHEAHYLKLDSSRAHTRLGWRPRWHLDEALARVVEWYAALRDGGDMRSVTLKQIEAFSEAL